MLLDIFELFTTEVIRKLDVGLTPRILLVTVTIEVTVLTKYKEVIAYGTRSNLLCHRLE